MFIKNILYNLISLSLDLCAVLLLCWKQLFWKLAVAFTLVSVKDKEGLHCGRVPCKGQQTMSPQNMPLWQEDYLELKAIEKEQIQAKLPALPLFA